MKAIFASAVALFCLSLPLQAQELTEDEQTWAMDFAMHDAIYSVYHEIGHMLSFEFDLPVLGRQEDAADSLAVLMMLTDPDDQDAANVALVDAADGWWASAVNKDDVGVFNYSFGVHSLDIERAFAMVCLMVGKDPEWFKEAAEFYELNQDQIDGCAGTYYDVERSWTQLLEPHLIKPGEETKIEVVYDDPGEYEYIAEQLKDRQILEEAAERIRTTYAMPYATVFRAKQCGEANAYYSYRDSELTYCYEMAEEMIWRYANTFSESINAEEAALSADEEYVEDAEAVEEE